MVTRRFLSREDIARVSTEILGDLLPGQTEQGVLEVSTTQKYRLGSRLQLKDGRVYRYARADHDRQLRAAYGVFPDMDYPESAVLAAVAGAGAKSILCTAQADVLVDEFKDGYVILSVTGHGQMYKITGNTAATTGNTFTVTLEDGLIQNMAITDTVTLFHNLWARVICMRQRQIDGVATDWRKVSCIGVPNRNVPLDNYCWIQTWGPCPLVLDSGTEGVADSERCMQFGDNLDALRLRDLGDQLGRHQIAGFILPVTTGGNIPCPGPVFLTISP